MKTWDEVHHEAQVEQIEHLVRIRYYAGVIAAVLCFFFVVLLFALATSA